ncbi:MAG: Asp-tRNA(Asn)/Glu-tRNA(Gln) amidotransferase subunit GatB [Mucilaginibacter polytrichastri]|nr:Asp-tRNA(Asn)/Glu-tRNA(Gln) amidotransferase subunit GatB [Mucilaginibacter polytrichastri]
MDTVQDTYEVVVGLEVHAQLLTESKIFASDSTRFGSGPNTQTGVISLALPGALPMLNESVLELAVKAGLATNCSISRETRFDRKNYFYADLPKGYQITQDHLPIAIGGFLGVKTALFGERTIRINRIHMEEDAGKSIHDLDDALSFIDLNRAGMPLIELVTEPDIRSGEEAFQFLTEIRRLFRFLDVCDGNMEEGSLRCDANISVRKKGATEYGQRCEVKNLNSIRNVQRAIESEAARQIAEIENGAVITQQTLGFDDAGGTTYPLREKETANDYRYFPEPDLPAFYITEDWLAAIAAHMPELPEQCATRFERDFGLSIYDAAQLTGDKDTIRYADAVFARTTNYKAAANWLIGAVRFWLNAEGKTLTQFPLPPEKIAALADLVSSGKVNSSIAQQKLFPAMIGSPGEDPGTIAAELGLLVNTADDNLQDFIDGALGMYADKVDEYRKGKKGLLGLFMGEVMKRSKGRIDPKTANRLLIEKLEGKNG